MVFYFGGVIFNWFCLANSNSQVHRAQTEKQGQRCHSVHRTYSCRLDKSSRLTDEVCVWRRGGYVLLLLCSVCLCLHMVCSSYAYVHACMWERAPICECPCVCLCVCIMLGVVSWGSSVSVPSATPLCWHPREWQKGRGIHFGKRNQGPVV